MITKVQAIKELTKLSLCYPATKYNNDEIEVMAGMWVESFADISPSVFIDACRLHREQSLWFPTLAEILERCKDVWEARKRNIELLPEPVPNLTKEQVRENAQRIRDILKQNRKLVWEQKHRKEKQK